MIVRDAIAADVPAIVAMLADDPLGAQRESPGDPAYARAFESILAQEGNRILVADEDGALLGCLQLMFLPGLSHRGTIRAEIESVRVAAAARGRGVGGILLEAALERARAHGCGLAQLTSHASREDAQRFYARHGFEPTHVGMKLRL